MLTTSLRIAAAVVLACLMTMPKTVVAGEKERINPDGVFKHPNFTRVITVKNPSKLVFVAGQTPLACTRFG